MTWKRGHSQYDPRPTVKDRPAPDESKDLAREGYVRAENPVMIDGQLLGRINEGPEKVNPEGSVDISDSDFQRK